MPFQGPAGSRQAHAAQARHPVGQGVERQFRGQQIRPACQNVRRDRQVQGPFAVMMHPHNAGGFDVTVPDVLSLPRALFIDHFAGREHRGQAAGGRAELFDAIQARAAVQDEGRVQVTSVTQPEPDVRGDHRVPVPGALDRGRDCLPLGVRDRHEPGPDGKHAAGRQRGEQRHRHQHEPRTGPDAGQGEQVPPLMQQADGEGCGQDERQGRRVEENQGHLGQEIRRDHGEVRVEGQDAGEPGKDVDEPVDAGHAEEGEQHQAKIHAQEIAGQDHGPPPRH